MCFALRLDEMYQNFGLFFDFIMIADDLLNKYSMKQYQEKQKNQKIKRTTKNKNKKYFSGNSVRQFDRIGAAPNAHT